MAILSHAHGRTLEQGSPARLQVAVACWLLRNPACGSMDHRQVSDVRDQLLQEQQVGCSQDGCRAKNATHSSDGLQRKRALLAYVRILQPPGMAV